MRGIIATRRYMYVVVAGGVGAVSEHDMATDAWMSGWSDFRYALAIS